MVYRADRSRLILAALALAATPGLAQAQAYRCAVPVRPPAVVPDGPDAREPARLLPTASYTLAISWTPQYCRDRGTDPEQRFQCASGNRFGFTLHGLWPDGAGRDWPQYCRSANLLSAAELRRNLCATPSAQLLQHEWAKHGTCMSATPAEYFAQSTGLYSRLRYPDMNRLSRTPQTAGSIAAAFARANRGMRADMVRVTTNRSGWLSELWLCMDRRFRFARCAPNQGGGKPVRTPVKIWRGAR